MATVTICILAAAAYTMSSWAIVYLPGAIRALDDPEREG